MRGDIIMAEKDIAFADGDLIKARDLGEEYLEIRTSQQSADGIRAARKFLAEVYAELGNSEKSLEHLTAYTRLNDSLTNSKNIQALTYYQTLYETEKRDAQINAQQSSIQLLEAENTMRQRKWLFRVISLIGTFFVLYLYISRKNLIERKKQQRRRSSR